MRSGVAAIWWEFRLFLDEALHGFDIGQFGGRSAGKSDTVAHQVEKAVYAIALKQHDNRWLVDLNRLPQRVK